MILELLRVSLHPWVWFAVCKPAVIMNTDSPSIERRGLAASVLRVIDSLFDPDDPEVLSPYQMLSSKERQRRIDVAVKAKADGAEVSPADRIPAVYLRAELDFKPTELSFFRECLQKFAARPDVTNEMAQPIIDAMQGVEMARKVTVDTIDKAPPVGA